MDVGSGDGVVGMGYQCWWVVSGGGGGLGWVGSGVWMFGRWRVGL